MRKGWIGILIAMLMVALPLNLIFNTAPALSRPSPHFLMIFPEKGGKVTADGYLTREGETKTMYMLWGHPFEHHLFDIPSKENIVAKLRKPDGSVENLTFTNDTATCRGETYPVYRFSFTTEKRGDYMILARLKAPEHMLIFYTKAIVHCGNVERGWDAKVWENPELKDVSKFEILPYTRPYGIEEGFAFTAKALSKGSPMEEGTTVEVEKYYSVKIADKLLSKLEEELPAWYDPSMLTRVTKTGPNGMFTYTLDEPGIWFVAAYGPGITVEGVEYTHQCGVEIVPVRKAFGPKTVTKVGEGVAPKGLEEKVSALESDISELRDIISGLKEDISDLKDIFKNLREFFAALLAL